jgi:hypothetical protein
MSTPLQKKILIVGSSDGIGLHAARMLLADGWQVFGISRRTAPIDHPSYNHAVVDLAEPGRLILSKRFVLRQGSYPPRFGIADGMPLLGQWGSPGCSWRFRGGSCEGCPDHKA